MTARQETSTATEAPAVRAVTAPARPEPPVRPVATGPSEPSGTGTSGPGVFDADPAPSGTGSSDPAPPPVRHRHLMVFAATLPAAGAAGLAAAIIDATVTALVLSATIIGGLAARWLWPRLLAWVTAALAFLTGGEPR